MPENAKSRTIETYSTLRGELLDGKYAPRSRLRIDLLSEALSVSPGAVREALSRLTSDGLVSAEPQKGFSVAPISATDLADLTSVRIEIETRCLRRSILLGDITWEGRIVSSFHQLSRTEESKSPGKVNPDWARLHAEFHDALVAACDSVWWLKLRDQLFTQAERYRRFSAPYARVERNVQREHREIMEATLARNAVAATDLLTRHLQLTADILLASDAPFDDVPHPRAVEAAGKSSGRAKSKKKSAKVRSRV